MLSIAALARGVFALGFVGAGMALAAGEGKGEGVERREAVALSEPRSHGVGHRVVDVDFGDGVSLGSLLADESTKAVVIAVRDADCPLSKKGRPTLEALVEASMPRGVKFVYVYPGAHQTKEAATSDLDAEGLIAMDAEGGLAAALGARSTTEVFLVDTAGTLRFRGAVDDQHGLSFTLPEPRRHFLASALDAVLAGKDVDVPVTSAPGCVLEFDGDAFYNALAAPTYHRDVARIIQDHCLRCHRDDGVAPFTLGSYDDVRGRRGMLRYVVDEGIMPPWGAVSGSGPWRDDPTLSDADAATLNAWFDADMPEGDAADAPLARHFPDEWTIGEPDAVYRVPEPFEIPASGVVNYRYAYVQTTGETDRWIRALEVRPTAGEVVHHVLVFIEEPRGEDESRDDWRRRQRGGLDGYFAGYIPGQGATVFGDGLGQRLPANASLKFQIHYTPNGRPATDQTEIGFIFTDEKPDHVVRTSGIFETRFTIPAGAEDHVVEAAAEFGKPATLFGFSPHMHLRGKAFRFVAVYPDGTKETLLDVPKYDFNWQRMYRLREPKVVPGGTRVVCVAHYDNSENNPANPDPKRNVRFGEQTADEMMIGYMEWWR